MRTALLGFVGLCCTNNRWSYLTYPQTDLWHAHGRRRPEMGEAIQDSCTDLQLRDLSVKVTRRDPFAEQFEAAHFGFDQAAPVVTAPFLPDGASEESGCPQYLVAHIGAKTRLFPSGVSEKYLLSIPRGF